MNVSCISDGVYGTRSEGGGGMKKYSDPLVWGVNLVYVIRVVGAIGPLLLSLKRGSYVSCRGAVRICVSW